MIGTRSPSHAPAPARPLVNQAAFAEADDGSGPDDTVEFGLQRVLDGVEAFVLARSNQPESR